MRKILTALALACSVTVYTGSAGADTLRVGNEADFPPFSQKNADGTITGFDIDIIDALCERMNTKCEIVVQEWSTIIPALDAGKYDVIISSMDINAERRKKVLFSQPYYLSPYAFVAKKDVSFEHSAEGLSGKKVCMIKNSSPIKWLQEQMKADVLFYDGPEEAKFDLIAGRCDTWLETQLSLSGTLLDTAEGKDFHFVGPSLTDPKWFGEGVGIAARMDDKELIDKIDAALDEIYADGTFRKINDKYFSFYTGAK